MNKVMNDYWTIDIESRYVLCHNRESLSNTVCVLQLLMISTVYGMNYSQLLVLPTEHPIKTFLCDCGRHTFQKTDRSNHTLICPVHHQPRIHSRALIITVSDTVGQLIRERERLHACVCMCIQLCCQPSRHSVCVHACVCVPSCVNQIQKDLCKLIDAYLVH